MNSLLIPARYASKRFPAKMCANINGLPLIYRTYLRVKDCQGFDEVKVLVEHINVMRRCEKYGMPYAVTERTCKNGTERCADYACIHLDEDDLIVNVQGDEPMMDPAIPQRVLFNLQNKPGFVWTAVRKIGKEDIGNENIVKCCEKNGFLTDFDRCDRSCHNAVHIGVYGYSAKRVVEYMSRRQTTDEIEQSLEQLRWGEPLAAITCEYDGIAVDLPEHIAMVEERLK